MKRFALPFLLVCAALPLRADVTAESLLLEMTDLGRLAQVPSPHYLTRQFSSYDRGAKSPTENWFANGDAGKYLRFETNNGREEAVMAEMDGPGAVVRVWSANPGAVINFYFDGEEKPRFSENLADLLSGKVEPFGDPFAGVRSHGANLYFPIPYAKSLKITMSGDLNHARGMYYQIMYRTYDPGTTVKTFTLAQAWAAARAHPEVRSVLADPSGLTAKGDERSIRANVSAGGAAVLLNGKGPGRIVTLQIKAEAGDLDAALRGVVLTGTFDGRETIWAPLGDLFGTAPGINPFNSLPLEVSADGTMTCRWVMPFRTSAVLRVANHTSRRVAITGKAVVQAGRVGEEALLFHAKWRSETMNTRPMRDWTFLDAEGGPGVFVGTSLAVANPVSTWWGEGDEKIYLDGETFPGTFGTGTEDYYGYAWGCPDPFFHAYHNQPRCDGPGNKGHTLVDRFHIIDAMPFDTSFRFDMEVWHWAEVDVTYEVTSYWYAAPDTTDNFVPASAKRLVVPVIPEPPHVEGAVEGEKMQVIEMTGGQRELQTFPQLSYEQQLWWRDAKPGDRLRLVIPVPKAGRYEVEGNFCTARDYGIHQLRINGRSCGGPIDFYDPELKWRKRTLGTFELLAGTIELEVEVIGANEEAIKSHMFGLDYILLKPVK